MQKEIKRDGNKNEKNEHTYETKMNKKVLIVFFVANEGSVGLSCCRKTYTFKPCAIYNLFVL